MSSSDPTLTPAEVAELERQWAKYREACLLPRHTEYDEDAYGAAKLREGHRLADSLFPKVPALLASWHERERMRKALRTIRDDFSHIRGTRDERSAPTAAALHQWHQCVEVATRALLTPEDTPHA